MTKLFSQDRRQGDRRALDVGEEADCISQFDAARALFKKSLAAARSDAQDILDSTNPSRRKFARSLQELRDELTRDLDEYSSTTPLRS